MLRLRARSSRALRVNSFSPTLLTFWVRAYLEGRPKRESFLRGDRMACRQPPFSFSLRVDFIASSGAGRTEEICCDLE